MGDWIPMPTTDESRRYEWRNVTRGEDAQIWELREPRADSVSFRVEISGRVWGPAQAALTAQPDLGVALASVVRAAIQRRRGTPPGLDDAGSERAVCISVLPQDFLAAGIDTASLGPK